MSTWRARLAQGLKARSGGMHPFPCSALLACFGSSQEPAPFDQPGAAAEAHATTHAQPTARADSHCSPGRAEGAAARGGDSGSSTGRNGSAKQDAGNHAAAQPAGPLEGQPRPLEGEPHHQAVTVQTPIPRPSIINRPEVSGAARAATGWVVLGHWSDSRVDSHAKTQGHSRQPNQVCKAFNSSRLSKM